MARPGRTSATRETIRSDETATLPASYYGHLQRQIVYVSNKNAQGGSPPAFKLNISPGVEDTSHVRVYVWRCCHLLHYRYAEHSLEPTDDLAFVE